MAGLSQLHYTEYKNYKTTKGDRIMNNKQLVWNKKAMPHSGWAFVSSELLNKNDEDHICDACGINCIRTVFTLHHKAYGYIEVGCECAGKLTEKANEMKDKNKGMKNRAKRFDSYLKGEELESAKRTDTCVVETYTYKGKKIWWIRGNTTSKCSRKIEGKNTFLSVTISKKDTSCNSMNEIGFDMFDLSDNEVLSKYKSAKIEASNKKSRA
jgi:hypothetical protein